MNSHLQNASQRHHFCVHVLFSVNSEKLELELLNLVVQCCSLGWSPAPRLSWPIRFGKVYTQRRSCRCFESASCWYRYAPTPCAFKLGSYGESFQIPCVDFSDSIRKDFPNSLGIKIFQTSCAQTLYVLLRGEFQRGISRVNIVNISQ